MEARSDDAPIQEDATPGRGKAGAEIMPAEKDGDHSSDAISNEEMAAFDKIMDEIDDQEAINVSGSGSGPETGESGGQTLSENETSAAEDRLETSDNETGKESDDGLDADQQKAFESIMSQIEGGGSGDDDAGPEASPVDPPEVEATDDFSAELEKVVQEADAAENGPAAVEESDDGLDADQQKAFESIMSQIEGGGSGDDDAGPEASPVDPPEVEATDNFSAELEKVVQEADAAENGPVAVEGSDDGLDADQQKAFESIMSQIEGGGSGDGDAGPEASPVDPPEVEATDDFSGELEKVVQEADSQDGRSPIDEKDEEHLDGDLLEVVDDIKDPIDILEKPEAGEHLDPETVDSKPKDLSDGQDVDSSGLANDKSDDEPDDISEDIDDILKEISSSEDDGQLPETTGDHIESQANVSQDRVEETLLEISSTAGKDENSDVSEEKAPPAHHHAHQADDADPSSPGLNVPKGTEPLREAPASPGGAKKKIGLALTVAIFLLALAGYFYWGPKDRIDPLKPITAQDTHESEAPAQSDPVVEPVEPVIVAFGTADESRLKTAADSLDRLRNELIGKQEEIEDLRAYYQAGIDAEIQDVVDMVRASGDGGMSFKSALAEPRINLGLAAIQRRESYIKKLEIPVKRLFRDSEELLYLSRRAELLALMAGKTSDIDIDGFIQQVNEASQAHRSAMDQLNIDEVVVSPLSLEAIWKDIARQLSTTPVTAGKNQTTIKADNAKIWKDICDADYSEKHKLTALSPEAARCLAKWKGKDLFLNAVTDLSPEAARLLADWNGDWLGLNGLQELSPETAVHLARWKGKGLSLNGLSRLSPQVVAILSEWKGDQLELVNVKHMAYWENPKTRLFLSEDLERKRNAARN
jgi:hypothetical protein